MIDHKVENDARISCYQKLNSMIEFILDSFSDLSQQNYIFSPDLKALYQDCCLRIYEKMIAIKELQDVKQMSNFLDSLLSSLK